MSERTKMQYLPFWDAMHGAITSYLYCPKGNEQFKTPDETDVVQDTYAEDLATLRAVKTELHEMAQSGRRLFIICPVQYQTMRTEHKLLEFIGECRKIPDAQRRYLIFMIMGLPEDLSQVELQRQVDALSGCCYLIFGQTELGLQMNFQLLKKAGFDAVGIALDNAGSNEKVLMQLMEFYAQNARKAGFEKIFVSNIKSLSLATLAICSQFSYLAGSAIHDYVAKPDHIYRFNNENLFQGIFKRIAVTGEGDGI